MTAALYDPDEHERLTLDAFDPVAARDFVRDILRATDDAYLPGVGWPQHPEDAMGSDTRPWRGVYLGAAGTMWALTMLASAYDVELRHDYGQAIVAIEDAYRADPYDTQGTVVPSYFLGSIGIMTARYAITGDLRTLDRIAADMCANADNPAREVLWGSPGTAIAAVLVRERDGDRRFDEILRDVQRELWATRDSQQLWLQELYGQRYRFVGAAHGAVGNLMPFIGAFDLLDADRRAVVRDRIATLLAEYAIREGCDLRRCRASSRPAVAHDRSPLSVEVRHSANATRVRTIRDGCGRVACAGSQRSAISAPAT